MFLLHDRIILSTSCLFHIPEYLQASQFMFMRTYLISILFIDVINVAFSKFVGLYKVFDNLLQYHSSVLESHEGAVSKSCPFSIELWRNARRFSLLSKYQTIQVIIKVAIEMQIIAIIPLRNFGASVAG